MLFSSCINISYCFESIFGYICSCIGGWQIWQKIIVDCVWPVHGPGSICPRSLLLHGRKYWSKLQQCYPNDLDWGNISNVIFIRIFFACWRPSYWKKQNDFSEKLFSNKSPMCKSKVGKCHGNLMGLLLLLLIWVPKLRNHLIVTSLEIGTIYCNCSLQQNLLASIGKTW